MPKKPVKSLRIKKVELLTEDLFESSDIPEDFWSSVVPDNPESLKDSFWKSDKKLDPLFINSFPFNPKLKRLLKRGIHIRTRGDGLCGVYSIMALLIKYFPLSISENMKYSDFIDLLSPISRENGVEISINSRPHDIEEHTLCTIMNQFMEAYIGVDQYPSIAIFDFETNTVLFKRSESSRCLMKNLFTIVHKDRHFEALFFNEKDRKDIYMELEEFMRK